MRRAGETLTRVLTGSLVVPLPGHKRKGLPVEVLALLSPSLGHHEVKVVGLNSTQILTSGISCFPPRGEVTWDCVKTQLSEATHWTWLCLQDITVAFLDWALAMISQQ